MNPGFTDEAQQRLLGVLLDQLAHALLGKSPHARDTRSLVVGGGAADVRVQAAGRRGDEVDGCLLYTSRCV